MQVFRRLTIPFFSLMLAGSALAGAAPAPMATTSSLSSLAQKNVVIIIRHANAPGVGDPKGFDINVCPTQRNLDEKGREQARALGRAWKAAGIFPTRIFSSAWCRCLETAKWLEMGPLSLLPELGSSFEDPAARTKQTGELLAFIKRLDPAGGPYVMVTHQVNITDISKAWVDTGAGIVLRLAPGGGTFTMENLPATLTN